MVSARGTGGATRNGRRIVRIVREGRRYWSDKGTSRGKTAGIGWAPHDHSWTRCVQRTSKYLGPGAKGYCAKRMHDAIGIWPGSRANRGTTARRH